MFFYTRKNGEVVMRSEQRIQTDLIEFEKNPTNAEKEKLKENWKAKVKDGKLEMEKPQHVKDQEKPTVEELKELTVQAKDITDLKAIINKLLDKEYAVN